MGLKLLILLALLCNFGASKEHGTAKFASSRKFFEKKHCGEIHPDKETACIFNYDKVLRSTIGLFPTSCSVVCADLFIGKDCDLTEEELTLTFKNMKRLIGGLTVSGTNYTSAKFLAGLESIDTGSEQNILFEDNSEMIEIGLTNLTSIITDGWLISSSPKMKTLNLPNLKYTTPAESEYTHVELWIEKMGPSFCITFDEMEQLLNIRKADLTNIAANYCEPTPEDNICTKPAKGCTRILGDVEIGPDSDLNAMKSVEAIFGTLTIKNTSIESLNFLENLKYVAPLGTGSGFKRFPALQNPIRSSPPDSLRTQPLHDAGAMHPYGRLVVHVPWSNCRRKHLRAMFIVLNLQVQGSSQDWNLLKQAARTTSPKYAEVKIETRYMNSNFCITFNEMENLMSIDNVDLTFIDAIYCTPTPEDKICMTPAEGCTRIYGDVEIGPSFDLKLMKSVESIFGTLIINRTELSNLSFLENLRYVAPLGYKPAFLATPARGGNTRARGDESNIIVLDNNNEELSYNYEMCNQLKNQLNTTKNPAIDGSICYSIQLKAASRDGSRKNWIILGLIISAVVFALIVAVITCCCCCKKSQREKG
ncbi:hypothetical protein CAEBREN_06042 [Caenorhabditis brenneri]|uniref:Receptor L-domain domain-containing protein n=1 Tax=Caenorhabditis brenneri TaxID=135651 RepID=G0PHY7_CAEBE|nr:hypothetical protein CAEBREN_06042 [Caenorhabditis brenneri]